MALASVLLSLVAVVCTVLGVFAVIVPVLGSVLSFAAPAVALLGVVLGGVAISRARRAGRDSSGLALTGVILNTLAFVPALLGALTCGMCSAFIAGQGGAGGLQPNVQWQLRQGGAISQGSQDAGPPPWPAPSSGKPARPAAPDGGVAAAPPAPIPAMPAMPPPPLNPGPGGR